MCSFSHLLCCVSQRAQEEHVCALVCHPTLSCFPCSLILLPMAGSQLVGIWLLTGVASMNAPKYSWITMADVEVYFEPLHLE